MSKVAEKNSSAAFFVEEQKTYDAFRKIWGGQRLQDNIQANTEMISSILKLLEKTACQQLRIEKIVFPWYAFLIYSDRK